MLTNTHIMIGTQCFEHAFSKLCSSISGIEVRIFVQASVYTILSIKLTLSNFINTTWIRKKPHRFIDVVPFLVLNKYGFYAHFIMCIDVLDGIRTHDLLLMRY